jgi:hypothetical protein
LGDQIVLAADVVPELVAGFECIGGRGEKAVARVGDDLFEGLLGNRAGVGRKLLVGRKVGAGYLEAIEEETGAAGVERVGGESLENDADGELDGGAVLEEREVESGDAGLAGSGVGDGTTGGVVVIAEFLLAKRSGSAAASVDEDVAAAAAWLFGVVVHGYPLPDLVQSIRKEQLRLVLPFAWIKRESPACWPGFFF